MHYLFSFFFYSYDDHRALHLSLHDALPISSTASTAWSSSARPSPAPWRGSTPGSGTCSADRVTRSVPAAGSAEHRSEEHTSELQSHSDLVCRLLLEKKKTNNMQASTEHAN